jgi:hypothetical protein
VVLLRTLLSPHCPEESPPAAVAEEQKQRKATMQQKQAENERDADSDFQPDGWEDPRQRLSARAQAVLHAVTAWVQQLPAGTVDVTYTFFPPEDDYGSELLITLQPHTPAGGVLTIGMISDTACPFHCSSRGDERNCHCRRPYAFVGCPRAFAAFLAPPRRGRACGRGRPLLCGGYRTDPTSARHPQGEGVGSRSLGGASSWSAVQGAARK